MPGFEFDFDTWVYLSTFIVTLWIGIYWLEEEDDGEEFVNAWLSYRFINFLDESLVKTRDLTIISVTEEYSFLNSVLLHVGKSSILNFFSFTFFIYEFFFRNFSSLYLEEAEEELLETIFNFDDF